MACEHHSVNATHSLGCDLAAEVADQFGRVRLRVAGTSMAPTIRPGDLLSVERTELEEVTTGDIVVFARAGRLIAHRTVAKADRSGESCLVTRGDRTWQDDLPVSRTELVGRVTSVERDGTQIHACTQPSVAQQALSRLLRFSDHATYLYLRLAAL